MYISQDYLAAGKEISKDGEADEYFVKMEDIQIRTFDLT
jgi:hypothetical protein